MMENYGHDGVVDEEGRGMGTFTIFDWGTVRQLRLTCGLRTVWVKR